MLAGKLLHLYGRRHGDLERDYNYFRLQASHYSQGDGNFRDICQNRRSDVLLFPEVGESEILEFLGLIQLDGYNPVSYTHLFTLHSNNIATYYEAGHLTDLSGEELAGKIYPDVAAMVTYDGKLLGVPIESQAWGPLYNKAIFEECGLEVPNTLNELKNVVDVLEENGLSLIHIWGLSAGSFPCRGHRLDWRWCKQRSKRIRNGSE